MQHHRDLPPSSAPAILQCASYRSDSVAGPAAKRGTILHEALEAALEGRPQPHELQGEDMEEMLWAFAHIIAKTKRFEGRVVVEEKVSINGRDGEEISFGHADAHQLEK